MPKRGRTALGLLLTLLSAGSLTAAAPECEKLMHLRSRMDALRQSPDDLGLQKELAQAAVARLQEMRLEGRLRKVRHGFVVEVTAVYKDPTRRHVLKRLAQHLRPLRHALQFDTRT